MSYASEEGFREAGDDGGWVRTVSPMRPIWRIDHACCLNDEPRYHRNGRAIAFEAGLINLQRAREPLHCQKSQQKVLSIFIKNII